MVHLLPRVTPQRRVCSVCMRYSDMSALQFHGFAPQRKSSYFLGLSQFLNLDIAGSLDLGQM
jgi:hypothetical protein